MKHPAGIFDNRWISTLPLEHVPCPLCRADQPLPTYQENGFAIVRCGNCHSLYVTPRPTPEGLRSFYQKYYPPDPSTEEAWGAQMHRIFRNSRLQILSYASHGRLLDVGCGPGYFLREFQGTRWEAVGVDLSDDVVQRARRRHGVDARSGDLISQRFAPDSFDAVTLFYLLEHVPDPLSLLQEVRRVLRPGGLLLIRVPDMEPLVRLHNLLGFPRTFFEPPMHLCDLSPPTLRRILSDLGFERIRTRTGGSTAPPQRSARFLSRLSGGISTLLEFLSFGTLLLPGVSKTTTALRKPVVR